jgi:hypothetical protein
MDAVLSPAVKAKKLQRERAVFTAVKDAQQLEKQLLVSDENRSANAAFRRICYLLHELAQKYVPNTPAAFADSEKLTHCTKVLQSMGFKPQLQPQLDSAVAGMSVEVIRNSFEYRHLRNKIMASLSIIADLTERPTGNGTVEYQHGIREGYRRASEVAVMFLDDISEET